jgi:hypothetical protein
MRLAKMNDSSSTWLTSRRTLAGVMKVRNEMAMIDLAADTVKI